MTTQSNVSRRARSVLAILALSVLAQGPAPAAAAANWRIDPARTQIAFAIDAVGYPRTEGRFRRFDGQSRSTSSILTRAASPFMCCPARSTSAQRRSATTFGRSLFSIPRNTLPSTSTRPRFSESTTIPFASAQRQRHDRARERRRTFAARVPCRDADRPARVPHEFRLSAGLAQRPTDDLKRGHGESERGAASEAQTPSPSATAAVPPAANAPPPSPTSTASNPPAAPAPSVTPSTASAPPAATDPPPSPSNPPAPLGGRGGAKARRWRGVPAAG